MPGAVPAVWFALVSALLAGPALGSEDCVFFDDFPSTTLDALNWTSTTQTPTVEDLGIAEPSAPYSLRLNRGTEGVESRVIDLSSSHGLELTYWYERTAGGANPNALNGADLLVEYLDGSSAWVEIQRQTRYGPDMTTYAFASVRLLADAYHAGFRFRFRHGGTGSSSGEWFVDDVCLKPSAEAPPEALDLFPGTAPDTAVNIALQAIDDSVPAPLSFIITSLPAHATLSDPGAGMIASVPYTLVNSGNVVTYTPDGGLGLNASGTFTYRADDGGTPPTGGESNEAMVVVAICVFADNVPSATIDSSKWVVADGSFATANAIHEPSPPYSLRVGGYESNFNYFPGELESKDLDLRGLGGLEVRYWYQRRPGSNLGGDAHLEVTFRTASGGWMLLETQSDPVFMTYFAMSRIALPPEAYHEHFQLKFLNTAVGAPPTLAYYLDDICIGRDTLAPPAPPVAFDRYASVTTNTTKDIALGGTDEGKPDPPASLAFVISSLPANGQLSDPGSGAIVAVPYELVNAGSVVSYTASGVQGPDSFTYLANDGGTPPDGGDSNSATVTLAVTPCLFFEDFPTLDHNYDNRVYQRAYVTPITTSASGEPSEPYSTRIAPLFLSEDNIIGPFRESQIIDLSGQTDVALTFWYQHAGQAANGDLIVQYLRNIHVWTELTRVLKDEPPTGVMVPLVVPLPQNALHDEFQFRFTVSGPWGIGPYWYVDDICVHTGGTPPVAEDGTESVEIADVLPITLVANDDGMPGPLSYIITSLPANGSLSDPNAGAIGAVPYTLANGGNVVTYDPNAAGPDSFTFKANDGGTPPFGGDSNTATVSIDVFITATVVARHIFYDSSYYDAPSVGCNNFIGGGSPCNDDTAIDTSKSAALPGGPATTFANYISYAKGINGIMIDIANAPNAAAITAADVVFTNTGVDGPGLFGGFPVADAPAAAPSGVTVRLGEGDAGSDRVVITWGNADGATGQNNVGTPVAFPNNKNAWLQVDVLDTANTGVADRFWFGIAQGEGNIGNTAAAFPVAAGDQTATRDCVRRRARVPAATSSRIPSRSPSLWTTTRTA